MHDSAALREPDTILLYDEPRSTAQRRLLSGFRARQMQMPTIRSLTILSEPEARVPGQWRPWRPDIVIAYRGLVCVVEVDGHHHDKRYAADVSPDHVLMKSGFAFVEQVCLEDVETDDDDADLVVDWVIERLERLAS